MFKIVRKLFMSILAMLLAIGPITISNNEVHAEDVETQEVKVTVHWDDDDNAKNYRPETFTVNLYTKEKATTRYAVSLYDYNSTELENGDMAGLVFGPALGNNYANSYKSHSPSTTLINGYEERCIHKDDWETIVHWNNVEPRVYKNCVKNHCTKGIDLHIPANIVNPDYIKRAYGIYGLRAGDGVSVLFSEFNETVRNSFGISRIEYNTNDVWGTSTYRTFMNEQLLNAFPEVLRNAIGSTKVSYFSYSPYAYTLRTSYDKLFLLSVDEISERFRNRGSYSSTPYESSVKINSNNTYPAFSKFLNYFPTNTDFAGTSSLDTSIPKLVKYGIRMEIQHVGTERYLNYNMKPMDSVTRSLSGVNRYMMLSKGGVIVGSSSAQGISPCFALSRNSNTSANTNNNVMSMMKDIFINLLGTTTINAEGEDGKYSLTLPTADGDVDYVFNIPMNEEVTKITSQEPNNHYEQELDLDLSDMNNLQVNMRSNGPKVPGSTAKLKKYLVVKNDTEIPEAEFSFTVSAGTAIGAADNHATVYAGKDSDKVKVNGTAKTGKVTFTAGEDATAGPLTDVATADQKYAMKDIVLDFSEVSFDEPGVYRYILTEQENTNSAINNDSEPVRVVDVHVMWNDDETELVVDGYVGYYGSVTEAPKLLPDFEYEYEDTNGDETISNEEKEAQKEAYDAAYSDFIASIQDGSGKPAGSYVNAQEPIEVEAGEKSDKYVNNLDSANLSLTKEVKGNQGSKDQYFEFTVAITNAGKNTIMTLDMSEAENGITHENAATSFLKVSMDAANTKDDMPRTEEVLYSEDDFNAYMEEHGETPAWEVGDLKESAKDKVGQQIVADEDGSVTFKLYLHHNQTANLKGLPKGTTYTITETTAAGYNTTSENETGEIDTTDIAAKFINERSGVVPTGILVSASGGLALLALCIFGLILSFRRKLREED